MRVNETRICDLNTRSEMTLKEFHKLHRLGNRYFAWMKAKDRHAVESGRLRVFSEAEKAALMQSYEDAEVVPYFTSEEG